MNDRGVAFPKELPQFLRVAASECATSREKQQYNFSSTLEHHQVFFSDHCLGSRQFRTICMLQQALGTDTRCPCVFCRFVNSQFPGLLESGGGDRSTSCDPSSAFANPCFSSDGSALICCPFSCAGDEGQGPRCEGFVGDTPLTQLTSAPGGTAPGPSSTSVNGVCDPGSPFPNQCFSADGSRSVCCSASCPSSPGPVATCGS
jgi:hypothetical protein